jgi:glycerol kinase
VYVLAIDEGTTGVRALIFDEHSRLVGGAYEEVESTYPRPGWMEQDPQHLWHQTMAVVRRALRETSLRPDQLSTVGVATQRATVVVWERATGRPICPAIVWQDTRAAHRVEELLALGFFVTAQAAATKLEWILDHVAGARERAEAGELCFGTVDSWLVWNLTGGAAHVTDHSNASCTALADPFAGGWHSETLAALRIPVALMPRVVDTSGICAETSAETFGAAVPIGGLAGDQQAAMFAELATERGAVKVTFGTSAMVDINTGDSLMLSENGAYPLVLWSLAGQRTWCLEGTVLTSGAAVQWLRDGLGIIADPRETGPLAESVGDSGGVWVVPALQGLGTPHMQASGRAVVGGISRGTTRAHIVRAVLEGIAYRTREALDALLTDVGVGRPACLRVDGGAAANDFLLQSLADTLGTPVERPETVQATGLGVAFLAGIAAGVWGGLDDVRNSWRSGGTFEPRIAADQREDRYQAWRNKVEAARLGPLSY